MRRYLVCIFIVFSPKDFLMKLFASFKESENCLSSIRKSTEKNVDSYKIKEEIFSFFLPKLLVIIPFFNISALFCECVQINLLFCCFSPPLQPLSTKIQTCKENKQIFRCRRRCFSFARCEWFPFAHSAESSMYIIQDSH